MSEFHPFLKSLIGEAGLSGHEESIKRLVELRWAPLVDEVHYSRLGSLHSLKRGGGNPPRPSVMIASHMDAIGLMVSRVVGEFLSITEIGSIDPRILPGTPVLVLASKGADKIPGIITLPPEDLLFSEIGEGAAGSEYLIVDVGLTEREVSRRIQVGDLVSFNTPPVDLPGGCLSGHSLDNRASIAALTVCLEELQSVQHVCDVWAVATVQEETTMGGAASSAFHLHPTLAVVVDMSYGQGAGTGGRSTFPIGGGPTLGIGGSIHPFLHQRFTEVAHRSGIPVVNEAMPAASLTDADVIQLSAEGVPTMVIGIPLRYMHTPVEVVALRDIQLAGRLLSEFVLSLEADFPDRIVWE
ncbi:MAG: M42 family metallopeptidase [Chloroflexi bacterium]|nr:M42 family metallopeptidase [Chloroflexota bacterium]